MNFTNTFINSFNDGFARNYEGTIVGTYKFYSNIEDIIPIDDINHYFEFLNKLPDNKHKEISLQIWRYVFHLKVINPNLEENNKSTLNNRGTQIKQNSIKDSIKKDLNSTKKFKEVIEKVFITKNISHKGKNIFNITSYGSNITNLGFSKSGDLTKKDTKHYNIQDLYEIVDLIIDDLETKEFKFISDKTYHLENPYTTKQDFKNYLIAICKKYNIKKYTDDINQLIDTYN